jgi:hypothetical protein
MRMTDGGNVWTSEWSHLKPGNRGGKRRRERERERENAGRVPQPLLKAPVI